MYQVVCRTSHHVEASHSLRYLVAAVAIEDFLHLMKETMKWERKVNVTLNQKNGEERYA